MCAFHSLYLARFSVVYHARIASRLTVAASSANSTILATLFCLLSHSTITPNISGSAAMLLDITWTYAAVHLCLSCVRPYLLVVAGIGKETVRVLARAGAKVIMTSRDLAAGQQAAKEITQGNIKVTELPSARLHVECCIYIGYLHLGDSECWLASSVPRAMIFLFCILPAGLVNSFDWLPDRG